MPAVRSRMFVCASLALVAVPALAHGEAMVFYPLVWLAVAFGTGIGFVTGYVGARPMSFMVGFAAYLTFCAGIGLFMAKSILVVPMATAVATAAGVVPFAALFFPLIWVGKALRSHTAGSSREQLNE